MKTILISSLLTAVLVTTGCDVDVNETSPATPPVNGSPTVEIDADSDTPAENRRERREERRETLQDAIDNVDVEVGNGGVKVDVDGE
ncbi:hypothetical protein [Stieleria varia]|uniref:Uncharacterized protein n=1 Tax=Stieleria varia TaxID=2528005 RepID=A0A5C6ARG2_9BACT|nr:hypothetical protein [Stieleria varia]TWU02545.1 hypothetical protein Pla52n_35950 [Stieleria varia]